MSRAKPGRSLTKADAAGERHDGFRALGVAVSKLAAPIVVKRGGGVLVRLKADWPAIIGPDWAMTAWPAALGRNGVLKLRTLPSAAIELQHCAPLLIERINLYFGRAAVTRLVLVQSTFPVVAEAPGLVACSLVSGDVRALEPDARLSGIADPGLRAALGRLANAVSAAGG
jgi:hypothetical protein